MTPGVRLPCNRYAIIGGFLPLRPKFYRQIRLMLFCTDSSGWKDHQLDDLSVDGLAPIRAAMRAQTRRPLKRSQPTPRGVVARTELGG